MLRSLITLKALTYAPTGGIVAAPTTSLPEWIGGVRNWDYRYCWLRDATFTLYSLTSAGFTEEAVAWRDWLLRAVAGDPAHLQIMYGPAGERRLDRVRGRLAGRLRGLGAGARRQRRAPAVPARRLRRGARRAAPDALPRASTEDRDAWDAADRAILEFLERAGASPTRASGRCAAIASDFVHSKVMAWVAFDRAVNGVEELRARRARSTAGARLATRSTARCSSGASTPSATPSRSPTAPTALDASALMIPLVGFLPADDPRSRAPSTRSQRELVEDGFVAALPSPTTRSTASRRARASFLPCSFWLADDLGMLGPHRRGARAVRAARSDWPTTWVCSPRSTTPRRAGCSATSRRRSPTCR